MRGYKAFNKDWTCRGKAYKAGEIYTENGSPVLCEHGMHFCRKITDVFNYYKYDENRTVVAEVEAVGDIAKGPGKYCTNKLHIIREMSWKEVQNALDEAACFDRMRFCLIGTILVDIIFMLFSKIGCPVSARFLAGLYWLFMADTLIHYVNKYRKETIGRKLKKAEVIFPLIMNASIIICCLM